MPLEEEISRARKQIATDSYEMSIGELASIYERKELIVNPEFQRYFRWDPTQKTRFIESILLGIPTPSIFVFQNEDGNWELIDGLQRLSSVFEFMGILRKTDAELYEPSVLSATKQLPSLSQKRWENSGEDTNDGIGRTEQLNIRRSRIRVEILKRESDPLAKFELFQRLNTGGADLTEQEVRSCIAIMVNPGLFSWIKDLAAETDFKTTIEISENALKRQKDIELIIRFFVYRNVAYVGGLDVHEYLDAGLLSIATNPEFPRDAEEENFRVTFDLLNRSLGASTFKRNEGGRYLGQFLISAFDAISVGVSKNLTEILALGPENSTEYVRNKVEALWNSPDFRDYSRAGVRGTTRINYVIPFATEFFRP